MINHLLNAANQQLAQRRAELNAARKPSNYRASGWLPAALPDAKPAIEDDPPTHSNCRADSAQAVSKTSAELIPVYTSLAMALLQAKQIAAGRVWLLLHDHFNRQRGRSVISNDELIALICAPNSPLRLFSSRQWHNIRQLGDGRFWDVLEGGQLYIHGIQHVLVTMDCCAVTSKRVYLRRSDLAKSVKSAKRVLYLSFDATRKANPISRASKQQVSGIERTTQWRLEKKSTELKTTTNYELVTPLSDKAAAEDAAYTHQHASFSFIDHQGKQGPAGTHYLARQMPNSYHIDPSAMPQAAKGRSKKINQRLKTPVNKGSGESSSPMIEQQYYSDPKAATQARPTSRMLSVCMNTTAHASSHVWRRWQL